jgi:hypothetical protein
MKEEHAAEILKHKKSVATAKAFYDKIEKIYTTLRASNGKQARVSNAAYAKYVASHYRAAATNAKLTHH